jgi:hypothetical protein
VMGGARIRLAVSRAVVRRTWPRERVGRGSGEGAPSPCKLLINLRYFFLERVRGLISYWGISIKEIYKKEVIGIQYIRKWDFHPLTLSNPHSNPKTLYFISGYRARVTARVTLSRPSPYPRRPLAYAFELATVRSAA